jgi:muconolactone delta-isomerase
MATKKRVWRKPVNYTPMSLFVTPEQKAALKALSAKTLIPQQALLRKAIDDLLAQHRKRK